MKYIMVLIGVLSVLGIANYVHKNTNDIATDKTATAIKPKESKTPRLNLSEIIQSYKGDDKANFLVQLAHELIKDERPIFIKALKNTLEKDEANSVLEIAKKLKVMKLTEVELNDALLSLCRFKNDKISWEDLNKNLNKNLNHTNVNLDKICP